MNESLPSECAIRTKRRVSSPPPHRLQVCLVSQNTRNTTTSMVAISPQRRVNSLPRTDGADEQTRCETNGRKEKKARAFTSISAPRRSNALVFAAKWMINWRATAGMVSGRIDRSTEQKDPTPRRSCFFFVESLASLLQEKSRTALGPTTKPRCFVISVPAHYSEMAKSGRVSSFEFCFFFFFFGIRVSSFFRVSKSEISLNYDLFSARPPPAMPRRSPIWTVFKQDASGTYATCLLCICCVLHVRAKRAQRLGGGYRDRRAADPPCTKARGGADSRSPLPAAVAERLNDKL